MRIGFSTIAIPISNKVKARYQSLWDKKITGSVFINILGKMFAIIWTEFNTKTQDKIWKENPLEMEFLNEVFDNAFVHQTKN